MDHNNFVVKVVKCKVINKLKWEKSSIFIDNISVKI